MLDIPSITGIVAAVGVIVGVVLTVLQLRDLVKTRQTDLVVRLYSTFGSKESQEAWKKLRAREFKDYNDYEKKHGWSEVYQLGIFFEGIGVLLHRKLIDIELVDDLFTAPVKLTWEKVKPIAEELRKRDIPTAWEWFEHLYNELQKREQRLQQIQQ
jgi:hypothetical protein